MADRPDALLVPEGLIGETTRNADPVTLEETALVLANMVLARMDEKGHEKQQGRRGYTEHIYVRPQWRRRGLASALIARSLRVLKERGATRGGTGGGRRQ